MARKRQLTWQDGHDGRPGRWRKKYRGCTYYFPGGRGKTDVAAYQAALTEWEKRKRKIDEELPKPHQAEYEAAIAEWEQVNSWCRSHPCDGRVVGVAAAKIIDLRQRLSAAKPQPLSTGDTLQGYFTLVGRWPDLASAFERIAEALDKGQRNMFPELKGYADRDDAAGSGGEVAVIPAADMFGLSEIEVEGRIWADRLDVARQSSVPETVTMADQVESYLAHKRAAVKAGELSDGWLYSSGLYLGDFRDWFGGSRPVLEVTGAVLLEYMAELLRKVEPGGWGRRTANQRLACVRYFVRWLYQTEVLPELPRVMMPGSRALAISYSPPKIEVFAKDEISLLLKNASQRTTLFMLLGLNCAMTQRDISELLHEEIAWEAGTITRKRSKTREFANVPEVRFRLWPETLQLLRLEATNAPTGRVLANSNGGPLWFQECSPDGKLRKNDNVKNAFERLQKKTGIKKPFKSLKKTSATLIRGNRDFSSLESLFLGHAPTSISHAHYTLPPLGLLEQATDWLRTELEINQLDLMPPAKPKSTSKRKPRVRRSRT